MRRALTSIAAVLACGGLCAAQAVFQGLGLLPGADTGEGRYVSGDGAAVAGYCTNPGAGTEFRAFVWRATTGMQEVPPLPGATQNSPRSLSISGEQMVGVCGSRGYYWTQGGGLVELALPGATANIPLVLSGDGGTVFGSSTGARYRWTPGGGFVTFAPGTDDRSFGNPLGISDDGSRVVGALTGHSPYRGWLVTPAGQEYLPDLGGPLGSIPTVMAAGGVALGRSHTPSGRLATARWSGGISLVSDEGFWGVPVLAAADGSVFVYTQGPQWHVHHGSGTTPLAFPAGGTNVQVRGISGDGGRVWGTSTRTGFIGAQAWVWSSAGGPAWLADELLAGGATMTGWTITLTNNLSRDGTTFVGRATNPAGTPEVFRAVLPR